MDNDESRGKINLKVGDSMLLQYEYVLPECEGKTTHEVEIPSLSDELTFVELEFSEGTGALNLWYF